MWEDDVKRKYEKGNKILFTRDSKVLEELLKLMRETNHRTLVYFSFYCIKAIVDYLEKKYPNDTRPRVAYEKCISWSKGDIKMSEAKKALLEVHAMAKDIDNLSDIALCHAIGQGCAAVHVETHAIGFITYELTSIVNTFGIDNFKSKVIEKIDYYIKSLEYSKKYVKENKLKWADFLNTDTINKEKILYEKKLNN